MRVAGDEGLAAILQQGVDVVHWPRGLAPDPELAPFLGAEAVTRAWSGDVGELDACVVDLAAGLPERTAARVTHDVRLFAPRIGAWTGRRHVRARLEKVVDDACRRFHVDVMALRLLITYEGAGTEWLDDGSVDRSLLRPSDLDLEEVNARIVASASEVRRAAVGDVLVLKGSAYPGNELGGAVHKSPALAAGAVRLVLRLDIPSCGC